MYKLVIRFVRFDLTIFFDSTLIFCSLILTVFVTLAFTTLPALIILVLILNLGFGLTGLVYPVLIPRLIIRFEMPNGASSVAKIPLNLSICSGPVGFLYCGISSVVVVISVSPFFNILSVTVVSPSLYPVKTGSVTRSYTSLVYTAPIPVPTN